MAGKKCSTVDVNRSSKTGKFVTDDYRKTHQSTTEHEKIKRDTNKSSSWPGRERLHAPISAS
jgi:hypothetical protein